MARSRVADGGARAQREGLVHQLTDLVKGRVVAPTPLPRVIVVVGDHRDVHVLHRHADPEPHGEVAGQGGGVLRQDDFDPLPQHPAEDLRRHPLGIVVQGDE